MTSASLEMTCPKCKLDSPSGTSACPRCGGKTQSKTTLRILGAVLVGLGGLLMAGMAVLTVITARVIANSDSPDATTRFSGSESDMIFMYSIFALVFVFGLAAAVAGLWQIVLGRRNSVLMWVVIGLGIVFIIVGNIVDHLN